MDELKPCPFCGGIDVIVSEIMVLRGTGAQIDNGDGYYERTGYWRVQCQNGDCCALLEDRETAEQAESDWNNRPVESALAARVAELEEEAIALRNEIDRQADQAQRANRYACKAASRAMALEANRDKWRERAKQSWKDLGIAAAAHARLFSIAKRLRSAFMDGDRERMSKALRCFFGEDTRQEGKSALAPKVEP